MRVKTGRFIRTCVVKRDQVTPVVSFLKDLFKVQDTPPRSPISKDKRPCVTSAPRVTGPTTVSTALKRLNGFTGKNHFYRANRELGCLFRTEHTLNFMSDPSMRKRNRRGLLKGEQIHALGRDFKYGHQGKLNSRDWTQQKHSCSSLTLAIACIIYWKDKEIHRVIQENTPPENMDLNLLENISPVSWKNIILYGDYTLNRNKVVVK